MALRFSKGLRNFLLEAGSMKNALANGRIQIYTGAQPTDADSAVAGTLLATITLAAGAFTAEVLATGSVSLDSGGSGSVNTFTVNSLEIMGSATAFNSTLTQTAADIVTKINNNPKNLLFVASSVGATITITAKPGLGTLANGWVVATTVTTITKTDNNMANGVLAVNGLTFGDATAGVLSKPSADTWSGAAVATGTAGWFRYLGSVADAGAADASEVYIRMDGSVATSGSDLNMSNTNFVTLAVQTIADFAFTQPAA